MNNPLFRHITGFWILLLLLALPLSAAEIQVLSGHVPAISRGLTASNPLPATNRLNLAIALPLRNTAELTNLLQDLYNPASPNFRHFLTPDQFTERFGPTESDFQKVAAFAKANGLIVTAAHSNRVLLDVNARVADIERTFHLKMHKYRHPRENREFYAPDVEPSLNLSTPVLQISGLDNANLPKPRYKMSATANDPNASPNSGSGQNGTYAGGDFRAAYVPDTTLTGAGQTVGLLQFDGYNANDITFYENAHGLPNVTLTNVYVDGASGFPSGSGGEVEVSLDIEMAISMAPGLSKIIVYEAPNPSPFEDLLSRMANDNLAKQLSCSWYIPNGAARPAADVIFQQMAAQGQSFFNASGDFDAFTGLIPFPGDTPYITQVGGTTLTTTGPGGAKISESVWNRGNGIGTGGGISTQYSIPAYQTNINMAGNQGSTAKRNIPDVALTAENIEVRADGQYFFVGGTSCAAPLWAGFAALVNQQAAASGRPPIGFVNPAFDAIGTTANYSLRFNDITVGNNTSSGSPTKFFATNGYDLCTGWGTPNGQNLINALANPEPLLILPPEGFTAIGGVGGPFSASSQSLSLTNTGTNTLSWVLSNGAPWLQVAPTNGTLAPGGPATSVLVSLNSAASNLVVGNYSATIWFTNLNDNYGQSLTYTLTIIDPPTITLQPTNQAVLDGATATFSATVTGGLPLTYHWQLNATNLVDAGRISGATTNLLTISNCSSNDAGTYTLVVTNAAGTATSSNAVLSITPSAPVITLQPVDQTVYVHSTVQFSVTAIGTKPFFYQWTLGGSNLNGATNATLLLPNLQTNQSGNYAVQISNSVNVTVSSNALLTVNPLPPCDPSPAGLVSWWQAEGNPLDSTSVANGTLAGGVTYAPGEVTQAFSFSGNHSGVQLGNPTNLWLQNFTIELWLKRASSSIFSMTANEAELFAYDTSGYGLGMNAAGLFLTQVGFSAVSVAATVNDTNWHHVAVTKNDSTVVFYLDGVAFPAAAYNPGFSFSRGPTIGASGPGLLSSFYGSIDELAVYNRALSATEIQIISLVGPGGKCPLPPTITTQPANLIASQGSTVNFSVTAIGSPLISYQWAFNGTNLAGATNASLTLNNVQSTNAGNYAVLVSNPANSVLSSNALLTVNPLGLCDPPPAGLISWWQADGNTLDSAGFNSGVLVSGTTYGPGEANQGFALPGIGSGVQLGNPTNLQLQNFTIELWLKRASTNNVSGNATEAELFCYDTDGYGFGINDSGGLFLTKVGSSHTIIQAPVTGTGWHHLAVTKNSSTVVFYLDGVAYPAAAYDPGFTFSSSATIGASGPSRLSSFYGSIDEVAIFNRALTATEIQNIYLAGAAGKCPLPPTLAVQPTNQVVYPGSSVTFSAAAIGSPTLLYQWTFNGTNLGGATNSSLTMSNVQPANAGNYAVLVSNSVDFVLSSNAVLTVNPLSQCVPPPSGIVSWWKAEGNPLDAAGANNGVLAGGVGYGPGESGKAFTFSGNGAGVQLGGPANLALQNFTIESWIKRSSSSVITLNGGDGELFAFGSSGYGFGANNDGTLFLTKIGVSAVAVQAAVTDTNWHHVAVTKTNSTVVFYLDGAAYPAASYNPGFSFSTAATIGSSGPSLASSFYGSIDELAVYSRNLSAAEIQLLYLSGSKAKCGPPLAIATQPASQAARLNCSVILTVSAAGKAPLTYQWWKDGAPVAALTNSTVTFNSIQSSNFGTYFAVVSDAFGGSVASSNAVVALDHLPAPGSDTIMRFASGGMRIPTSALLTNDVDAEGDTLTIVDVSPNSFANGTVSLQGNWIYYTPPPNNTNSDIYTYTVSDGRCGGLATGYVIVQTQPDNSPSGTYSIQEQAGGSILLTFDGGIPGRAYRIQYTDSLIASAWHDLGTQAADGFGTYQFTDNPPVNRPTRYYRAISP